MRIRILAVGLSLLSILAGDCYRYAVADALLLAPVDSLCLKDALTKRLGPPDMRPQIEKRFGRQPTALWLYYNRTSFTQTYPNTGSAMLSAARIVHTGILPMTARQHHTQDSVSQQLGRTVLAVRDSCGGRAVPGQPEITYPR